MQANHGKRQTLTSDERFRRAWDGATSPSYSIGDSLPGRFRSRLGEINEHGRVYGGQLLGQAIAAAARTVPADRPAILSSVSCSLPGALPRPPIDYEVARCRTASASPRATSAARRPADASYATPTSLSPHRSIRRSIWRRRRPIAVSTAILSACPALRTSPRQRRARSSARSTIPYRPHVAIDFRRALRRRFAASRRPIEPRMRFWIKMRSRLPDDASLHAAAFAYLSDYWINFAGCIADTSARWRKPTRDLRREPQSCDLVAPPFARGRLAAVRLHQPERRNGRGLSIGRIYDPAGGLVASATQECLLAPVLPSERGT